MMKWIEIFKPKIILMTLAGLCLIGCATTFHDLKAKKNIQDGKIYIGMSKEEFSKIMEPPIFGIKNIITKKGTKYEVWDYSGRGFHNAEALYLFYFNEENKLVKWERDSRSQIVLIPVGKLTIVGEAE